MNGSLRYQSFIQPESTAVVRRAEDKIREYYSVADTGAVGDGAINDAAAINEAIANLVAAGGGELHLLNGKTYLVNEPIVFPAGFNGIILNGHGAKILRGADMPNEQGVFDLRGAQFVTFRDFTADGDVLVSEQVFYSQFAFDPAAPMLVKNTMFWMHPGCTDINFQAVTITHTGGYAAFSDTRTTANNQRIRFTNCLLINNRPHTFGIEAFGAAIYGSWTGGLFYKGDCSTAQNAFVTQGFYVINCNFERNTGNCVWGHNAGFYNFHSQIVCADSNFLDCGLDCIETSCTIGGAVTGNTGRRVGYICSDDTSQSTPAYLPFANATFIDHSGYCEGVNISNNSCSSICGGYSSLDGYAYGSVTGNNFRQPQPGDAFYDIDQVALCPAGVVYGFSCANTYGHVGALTVQGGAGIVIAGNALYGCSAGSIIAIAFREGKIADNDIWQPGVSTNPPILLGNQSTADYKRAYSNSITGNRIFWSPPAAAPAIFESEDWSGVNIPWSAGDSNWIEKNHIFDPTGMAYEVGLAPTTSSITGPQISSAVASPTAPGFTSFRRMTAADGTGGYTSILGTSGTEYFRFADTEILTVNGGIGTGVAATTFSSKADTVQAGTVTTAGTAVTRNTGPAFSAAMVGGNITINLVRYVVAAFIDGNHVTLGSSAGVQAGVAYIFGNAFQTSTNTMQITAYGDGLFQNLVASYVFNSRADILGGNAFQTSTTTMYITGAGYGYFQGAIGNILGIAGFASPFAVPGAGYAYLIYNTSTGYLQYNLGGAGWVNLGGSSGTVAGSNTWVQFNDAGAFGAVTNFKYDKVGNVLTITGAVTSGVVAPVFNSSATGANNGFQLSSLNWSVDGNGNMTAVAAVVGGYFVTKNQAAPAHGAGFAYLYSDASDMYLAIGAGAFSPIVTQAYIAGLGVVTSAGGAATRVAYYTGASALTGSANFTFAGNILTVGSGAGTGVIAPLFNANAGGSNLEFQGSNFSVKGTGQVATNGYLDWGNSAAPAAVASHNLLYGDNSGLHLSTNGGAFSLLATQAFVTSQGYLTSAVTSLSLFTSNGVFLSGGPTGAIQIALTQNLTTSGTPTFSTLALSSTGPTCLVAEGAITAGHGLAGASVAFQTQGSTMNIDAAGNIAAQSLAVTNNVSTISGIFVCQGNSGISGETVVTSGGVRNIHGGIITA